MGLQPQYHNIISKRGTSMSTATTTQYMMIENSGVCPIEGFTMLGLSTSRGGEDSIGQFGSGAKHGVNVLLRMGVDFKIYCGVNQLSFSTKAEKMGEHIYQAVYYKYGLDKPQKLSWALEYGELDWDSLDMAIREFVSNALDAVSGNPKKVSFSIVDANNVQEHSRHTRVYIELTPQVADYYNKLGQNFLHYNNDVSAREMKNGFIAKKEKSPCRVYRKGVFVHELRQQSYYDYNFGDNVKIDEARNMSAYEIIEQIGRMVAKITNVSLLTNIMNLVVKDGGCLESQLHSYDLGYYRDTEIWQKAHYNVFGNHLMASPAQAPLFHLALAKGYSIRTMESDNWYRTLENMGAKTVFNSIEDINTMGQQILIPCENTIKTLNKVWGWLEELGITNGKDKPECHNYKAIMSSGAIIRGYYKDDKVYISTECRDSTVVMLEELAHYITGATDNSRDFQQYFISALANVCELVM